MIIIIFVHKNNFYPHFETGQVFITEGNILVENMPIITPNGDVIVKSLSIQVTALI